jgi:hypothetical protein
VGGVHTANGGGGRNVYRLLVGKPEGNRPVARPGRKWVDNIKMDLLEIEWGGMDWICLAEDRNKCWAVVNVVMNLRVLKGAGKLPSGYTSGGLSSSPRLHRVN